jgi:plasmid stabilization system protein ParE
MNYTVVWKPSAKARLADIWMSAADRASVAAAANAIDRALAATPQHVGESRDETARILIESPLAVVYDVSEDDRLVSVLSVRPLPRHSEPNQ